MKPSSRDKLFNQLFGVDVKQTDTDSNNLVGLIALNASMEFFKRVLLIRSILAVASNLSLIASVWVFVFNVDLWYGVLAFAVLSAMFNNDVYHLGNAQNKQGGTK